MALTDRLQNLSKGTLAAVAFLFLFGLAAASILLLRNNNPSMGLLYGDLTPQEGGPIVTKLDTLGVNYQLKEGGANIYVPLDQVPRLRMVLAENGLPMGTGIGYELFDRSDLLGSTNFLQELNFTRALEGELARTIRSIQGVGAVRVHLTRPRRELFSKENYVPTAAITIRMQGRLRLRPEQVEAIQNLVAAAVTGLLPEKVTVVDQFGTLLGHGNAEPLSLALQEQKTALEARLIKAIESILSPVLGENKAIAHVNVVLDRNRLEQQRELFDADNPVVRSEQTSTENQKQEGNDRPIVSAQANTPQPPQPAQTPSNVSSMQKANETKNYEISKTIETHTREWGAIERLSAAVIMDNGGKKPSEMPKGQLEEIIRLVKAAVGFDEKRGDSVEVAFMPFIQTPESLDLEKAATPFAWKGLLHNAQMIGLMILLSVLFWFLARPLILRTLEGGMQSTLAPATAAASLIKPSIPSADEKPLLEEPSSLLEASPKVFAPLVPDPGLFSEHGTDMDTVKSLMKRNTELAATVLRQWIKES